LPIRDSSLDPAYFGHIKRILERLDKLEAASSSNNDSPTQNFKPQLDGSHPNSTNGVSPSISNIESDAEMFGDEFEVAYSRPIELKLHTNEDFLEPKRKRELGHYKT